MAASTHPTPSEDHRTETVPAIPFPRNEVRLSPGLVIGGRYEVRAFLGRGGHATAYRVFDREVKREVALKLLHPARETESAIARLRREVRVARDVESPRLVRIFDIGASPEGTYLTMELVEGASLKEHLRQGPLSIEESLRIARELFEGLAALHGLGIIHRDVKPSNILLAGDGAAKLADFGLARRLDREETQITSTEGIVGTLGYLSPEQVLGKEARRESDLYSAGLVLFEMLAGQLPHEAVSELGRHLGPLQRALDIRTCRREVPRWLARVVARLLEVRPADRYQNTEEVLRDLEHRRSPQRVRLRRWLLPAIFISLLVLPQIGILVTRVRGATFSHLVPLGTSGIAAVDSMGNTLWTKDRVSPEMAGYSALARITPRGPRLLAIVLAKPQGWLSDEISTLSFLDPKTGQVVTQVKLPSGAGFFPNDPPRFMPDVVKALDLSNDGVDEVLVSYHHIPEAPSYIVLYSPRAHRARIVFYAKGGYRFQGATDLDHDGAPELLFVGINNAWNWVNTVAAVRLDPWPWTEEQWRSNPTAPPGTAEDPSEERNLLWFAVVPRGYLDDSGLSIDESRRTLTLRYNSGKTWTLGFDGFPPDGASLTAVAAREAARRETYRHLRESERLRRAGAYDLAMAEARAAGQAAAAARELWLSQYAERREARLLVDLGKMSEAEVRFASLTDRAEDAPEVAYDAAVAFHLKGDLRRAISWYGRGIGREAALGAGKSKHEFLKGEVLALVEEKRYAEALAAVDRFGMTYPPWQDRTWLFREYVRWRAGERPEPDPSRVAPNFTDLERYWELEFESAAGGEPREMLRKVDRFLAERPETKGEAMSLRAELLARLGQVREAAEVAQSALELVQAEAPRSIVARGHAALVALRAVRLRNELRETTPGRETAR